jgi:hypothetical protein
MGASYALSGLRSPAKHLTSDPDGVNVVCRRCGDYRVTDAAFNALLRLEQQERGEILHEAQLTASAGARPTITSIRQRSRWHDFWQS